MSRQEALRLTSNAQPGSDAAKLRQRLKLRSDVVFCRRCLKQQPDQAVICQACQKPLEIVFAAEGISY